MFSREELEANGITVNTYDILLLRLLSRLPPRASFGQMNDEAHQHEDLRPYYTTMVNVKFYLTERLGFAFGYVDAEWRPEAPGRGWEFTLTEAGRAALREWDETHPPQPPRVLPQPRRQGQGFRHWLNPANWFGFTAAQPA